MRPWAIRGRKAGIKQRLNASNAAHGGRADRLGGSGAGNPPSTPLTRDTVMFALAMHKGEANGVRACDLVAEICGETSAALERQLRHLIEEMRREGEHICGQPSTGYFVAATDAELLRTVQFLHDRAMTSLTQAAAMQRVSLPDLRGQLRLPS